MEIFSHPATVLPHHYEGGCFPDLIDSFERLGAITSRIVECIAQKQGFPSNSASTAMSREVLNEPLDL